MIETPAVHVVSRADGDRFWFAEHVQEHDGQLIGASQSSRTLRRHCVKPTAAPRPACHGAVLPPGPADAFANATRAIVQFRREWALANACGVGFDDADDSTQMPSWHPGSTPNACRRCARAGHVRIRAVVHVE